MGQDTRRAISIAIGVAAGILISNAITFATGVVIAKAAEKAALEEIKKIEKEAKSARIERQINQLKETRRKALYEEMQKKESSDKCRFWRQQQGINSQAEQKIKQHCYTGPDPRSI